MFWCEMQPTMSITSDRVVYTRQALLALQWTKDRDKHLIPAGLREAYCGCRAGVKLKAKLSTKRWKYKPVLPSIVMGNVNSLSNKCDELEALVKSQRTYRETSLMCFTESWLNVLNEHPGLLCEDSWLHYGASGQRCLEWENQ